MYDVTVMYSKERYMENLPYFWLRPLMLAGTGSSGWVCLHYRKAVNKAPLK